MPVSIKFDHEGIPFRCWVQRGDAAGSPEVEPSANGQWMVEVGGHIHALCEATEDEDPAEIERRAIAEWELRKTGTPDSR